MATAKHVFTEEQKADMIHAYRVLNKTQQEIANKYGVSRKPINKVLKDNNVVRLFEDEQWLRTHYEINRLNKRQIAERANCNEMTIHKWMKFYGIDVDDTISRRRKYDYNQNYFQTIDSEQRAYWLGFILADGGVRYEDGEKRLTILLSRKDKNHLKKFRQAIQSNTEIKDSQTVLNDKVHQNSLIRIYSAKMVEDLMALNILPNKSANEQMPNIDSNLHKHLIRGIFDGDGCFSYWMSNNHVTCEWSIVSSLEVVTAIQNIVPFKTAIGQDGVLYKIRTTGAEAVRAMDWMYEDSTVCLDRKHTKFLDYLSIKDIV